MTVFEAFLAQYECRGALSEMLTALMWIFFLGSDGMEKEHSLVLLCSVLEGMGIAPIMQNAFTECIH